MADTAKEPTATPPSAALAPAATPAAAKPTPLPEPMPEAGGSYTRLPDGTLQLTNHYED